ncbi:MAG TPA: hypothetical protein VF692_13675, partial [Pyrinomonadaceae bacterium]
MKAAEKPAGETTGTCGKCHHLKDLPHTSNKFGLVCEDCYLEIKQINLPLDEYDLQPGEMTKEQAADSAKVSIRAIEKWIASGQLAAEKTRRRIAGAVRPTTILKAADVEKLIKGKNETVQRPTIERETSEQSEQTGLQADSPQFAVDFMQMLQAITH